MEKVSEKFIQNGVIPVKYSDDAVHLALALCNNIDYIFSWNFKHMVKLKTKRAIRLFAIKEGYKELEIVSPQEVTEDDD